MNSIRMALPEKTERFAENYHSIRKHFIWHEPMIKRLVSLVYALDDKDIDLDKITYCHNLMKAETGIFSTFRGNLAIYVAAMLALDYDPYKRFTDTLEAYNLLKGEKFWASDYLVASAYEVARWGGQKGLKNVAVRAMQFYRGLKANHRFHIGQDDYIFVVMLALSDIEVSDGVDRVKQIFMRLRPEFFSRNSALYLAQMLVLSGKGEDSVDDVLHLNRMLKQQGIRLNKTYTLPSLGVLSMLDTDHSAMANAIDDTMAALRRIRGFGRFSVSKQELLMHVVAIVSSVYLNGLDDVAKASLSTNITNLIIAQQAAMLGACVGASVAASSAAASC